MKSMTGYGRGECAQDCFKVTVELSSVNRRQSDISLYLPRELEALESRTRDETNRRLASPYFAFSNSFQNLASSFAPKSARILPSTSITGATVWPESRCISS